MMGAVAARAKFYAFVPDFLFTTWHLERGAIVYQYSGSAVVPGGPMGMSRRGSRFYQIKVLTSRGEVTVEVTKDTFNTLRFGDAMPVRYRQGRRSGILRGKIAC